MKNEVLYILGEDKTTGFTKQGLKLATRLYLATGILINVSPYVFKKILGLGNVKKASDYTDEHYMFDGLMTREFRLSRGINE